MKADTVAEILINEIICRHGAPKQLLSDQGANFMSNLMKQVCEYFKINKINTAPYHPQFDGLVERFNKTLCQMLAAYSNSNQSNWDIYLPLVLFAYRTSEQTSTKESPFTLLYGRDASLPSDLDIYNSYQPSLFIENLNYGWREAKRQIVKQAEINKKAYDSKYVKDPEIFKEGEFIRLRQKVIKPGLKRKLSGQKYTEPLKITKVISPQNIEIEIKGKKKVVNVNNVKKREKQREQREIIRESPTVTRSGRVSIPRINK
jgi:hypothetical protein